VRFHLAFTVAARGPHPGVRGGARRLTPAGVRRRAMSRGTLDEVHEVRVPDERRSEA